MRTPRPLPAACLFLAALFLPVSAPGQQAPGDAPPAAEAQDQAAAGDAGEDTAAIQPPTETEEAGQAVGGDEASAEPTQGIQIDYWPATMVLIGIVAVLGMIIGLKLNAFMALIISALIVSLLVGFTKDVDAGTRMNAVVSAFGNAAGGIGIVIAMAAIIGKCMLDSGAADRIVRSAVAVTGEKKVSLGLMISGFILAVPVFFDTVFYLLVPLARSLYRRTGQNYLRYLMAIATGGAITHTLVPPTPGPLLVAAILGVDIGMMMLVGALVAFPSSIVGLVFSVFIDRRSPVPMRPLGASEGKHEPLTEAQLPALWISLLPVVLPVVLIGSGTLATTLADREDRARLRVADIRDYQALAERLEGAEPDTPAGRILASGELSEEETERLTTPAADDEAKEEVVGLLNEILLDRDFYSEEAFLGIEISDQAEKLLAADQVRMKPVDRRRMNRILIEDAFPELIQPHDWDSPARRVSRSLGLWSNPNFALLLAAVCAMFTVKAVRSLSWRSLSGEVEESLMSGGVIILITSAGGAFGAMLSDTDISDTIQRAFAGGGGSGVTLLLLGWAIAAFLKVAQGSSTVAMIVGAGMMAAIIGEARPSYHMVYIATAVGSGSLMGSWMNDSGFWVFTKMGGLTEGESLRSWTPLLVILSLVGLGMTILLSRLVPLAS